MLFILAALQLLIVVKIGMPLGAGLFLLGMGSVRYLPVRKWVAGLVLMLSFCGFVDVVDGRGHASVSDLYALGWPTLFFLLLPNRIQARWRGALALLQWIVCIGLADHWGAWCDEAVKFAVMLVAFLVWFQLLSPRLSRLANTAALSLGLAPLVGMWLQPGHNHGLELLWIFGLADLSRLLFPQLLIRRLESR